MLKNIWCYLTDKNKTIIDYVIRWLDSNIDEPPAEGIQEDSANLKEKINLALDPGTTAKDIEDGNFYCLKQLNGIQEARQRASV